MTDGDREHRGREPGRLIVDGDERVANVGVDDDRAGLRVEPGADVEGAPGWKVDGDVVGLVPLLDDEQRVPTGRHLRRAGQRRAEDLAVLGVELHDRTGRVAVDLHGSQDGHQRQLDLHFLADLQVDTVLLRGLVAGELDDDLVPPGAETEISGALAARSQILAIEEHCGPRRIGDHLQHGDAGGHAPNGVFDDLALLDARLGVEGLGVVPVRVGRLAQLLVGARNVVEDVAVRHEAVGREVVLESPLEVLLLVRVVAQLELQIRLVGEIVRGHRVGDQHQGEDEKNREFVEVIFPWLQRS